MFSEIFKSKKIAPNNTNNLILEIVEEYNKELYKSKVLKEIGEENSPQSSDHAPVLLECYLLVFLKIY